MNKTLLILIASLFVASCEGKQSTGPKSCAHENQQGSVFVMVSDSSQVLVDGLEYRAGLIAEHFKVLERTCEWVRVLISMPKGAMTSNSELFFELLMESPNLPDGNSSVTLVERK